MRPLSKRESTYFVGNMPRPIIKSCAYRGRSPAGLIARKGKWDVARTRKLPGDKSGYAASKSTPPHFRPYRDGNTGPRDRIINGARNTHIVAAPVKIKRLSYFAGDRRGRSRHRAEITRIAIAGNVICLSRRPIRNASIERPVADEAGGEGGLIDSAEVDGCERGVRERERCHRQTDEERSCRKGF